MTLKHRIIKLNKLFIGSIKFPGGHVQYTRRHGTKRAVQAEFKKLHAILPTS